VVNKQKDIERFYLDEFFKIFGNTPEIIESSEAPDFTVRFGGKKFGIEVTEYHSALKDKKDIPRRAIEEGWQILQKLIMEEVEKYYELKNTHGILFFKDLELPTKSQYKSFVSEIIELSLESVKTDRTKIEPDLRHPILKKYLIKFEIRKVGIYITWDWNKNASFIGLEEDGLINVIKPKLLNYKDSAIDELWLLVISGHRLSQTMPMRIEYELRSYYKLNKLLQESEYKKVYIFKYMFGVIYEWPGWQKIGREKLHHTINP